MAVTAATAKAVRKRDRVCRLCEGAEFDQGRGRYVVHHVTPKGLGGTDAADRDHPDKLALLHDACHREVHANPRQAREAGLLESRLGTVRPSALLQRGPA
jgi:hypothetical protein